MSKISVITPTARPGCIGDMVRNLKKQTFQDFEWIVPDGLYWERKDKFYEFMKDKGIKYVHTPDKRPFKDHKYNLNNAFNTGVIMSSGELLVWIQDFIAFEEDALEKFWNIHKEKQPCLITGADERWKVQDADNKDDMIDLWDRKPKLIEKEKKCWRKDPSQEIPKYTKLKNHRQYELNWAAISWEAMKDVGGFDERFDKGFNYDNNWLAWRALKLGYPIYFDQTNKCKMYNHWTLFEHNKQYQQCTVDREKGVEKNARLFKTLTDADEPPKMTPFNLNN